MPAEQAVTTRTSLSAYSEIVVMTTRVLLMVVNNTNDAHNDIYAQMESTVDFSS